VLGTQWQNLKSNLLFPASGCAAKYSFLSFPPYPPTCAPAPGSANIVCLGRGVDAQVGHRDAMRTLLPPAVQRRVVARRMLAATTVLACTHMLYSAEPTVRERTVLLLRETQATWMGWPVWGLFSQVSC